MTSQANLNIISEDGKVIGEDSREHIHKQGLLHQEVHVWFFTPDMQLIFQHRAKDKDTFPDLLDATVGGHVEKGDSYVSTAVKECYEETGLVIDPATLIHIETHHHTSFDALRGRTNHVLRATFAYRYTGRTIDLRIEEGKGIGFEAWPIEKLFHLTDTDRQQFIPFLVSPEMLKLYKRIEELR